MGIWDLLFSATAMLKRNVPDPTTVANVWENNFPSPQTQEKIKRIAKEVAVPELLRFTGIPALAKIYRIWQEDPLSSSVHDSKKSEHQAEELKTMQMKNEELREEGEKIKHDDKIPGEQIVEERTERSGSHNDSCHF